MMKIGILTLFYHTYNFGAQLQAYALQKTVESLGVTCEQICFVWSKEQTLSYYESASINHEAFATFSKSIPHSKRVYTPETISEAEKEYDGFICGSDQIWGVKNSMPDYVLPQMALSFVRNSKKKIVYGASLGSMDIEENRKEILKSYLNRLDFISVREPSVVSLVEELSGNSVEVVMDPVLLLSVEKWRELAISGNGWYPDEDYVLLYSVSGKIDLYEKASNFAKEKSLSFVYIAYRSGKQIGPYDFIALFDHATYVITDSFHGTTFSIIFQKKFIVFGMDSLSDTFSKNIRIRDLLKLFELESRFFKSVDENWKDVLITTPILTTDGRSKKNINNSIAYLKHALDSKMEGSKSTNISSNLLSVKVINQGKCMGCGACIKYASSCLQMKPNKLGFYYPILDEKSCINCKKCLEICPIYHSHEVQLHPAHLVFATWAKEKEILEKSASGGIFFIIAENWINRGGVVYGAIYDAANNFEVKHVCADTKEGLFAMRKSKYVQSNLGQCFSEVERYLKEERQVLFSGTPCQIAGLKAYLEKDYINLYTIDLICGGVTAPLLWKKYVEFYQKKGKVESFDMRSKAKGFFDPKGKLAFSMSHFRNGNEYVYEKDKDLFLRPRMSFYGESCYQCQFKGDRHDADLTIGDFVGFPMVFPQKSGDNGVSLVMIRSEKGKELFNICKSSCEIYLSSYEDASFWNEMINSNIKKPLGMDYLRGIAPNSSAERIYYEHEKIRMFKENEELRKKLRLEQKRNDLLLKIKKYTSFQCKLEYNPLINGKIVIYGAGKLGKALLECMEGEPLCFLDRVESIKNIYGYPVYRMCQKEFSEILSSTKVTIVVTPVWDYWEIRENLEEIYSNINIVSLEKLMEGIGK